ncbi:MAG: sialidase family protein, partial [Planctomycetota bacterium]
MVFSLRHAQLLAISVTTLVACSVNPTDPREAEPHIPLPRPSGFEEGEDSQAEREAWIESMHSAAPGFDWRAEEQKNKLDAMARRETALMSRAPSDGSWNEVGSNNLAGSTFVAVQSTDGQELYVGSAHGGVFRGPKDGSDWVAIGDGVYGGAHHLLTIPPAGGGQDIVLRAVNGAMWRSLDNGTTWQAPTGLTGMSTIHRLLKLDDSQQTILMVAWQSGWKLFRSVDRGASFTVARDLAGDSDIFTPRTGLGSVYLFEQDRMYESTDAGVTFQAFGNPLGFHPTDVKLGGHEASGNTTFSLAANDGGWELWRTTDSANSWSFASDMPEMWSAFCTSATDEDLLVYGGVELWVSRDGGNSFSVQNWWWEHPGDRYGKLHADIMGVSVVEDAALSSG